MRQIIRSTKKPELVQAKVAGSGIMLPCKLKPNVSPPPPNALNREVEVPAKYACIAGVPAIDVGEEFADIEAFS